MSSDAVDKQGSGQWIMISKSAFAGEFGTRAGGQKIFPGVRNLDQVALRLLGIAASYPKTCEQLDVPTDTLRPLIRATIKAAQSNRVEDLLELHASIADVQPVLGQARIECEIF